VATASLAGGFSLLPGKIFASVWGCAQPTNMIIENIVDIIAFIKKILLL
jgi:hypothetical protein